MQIPFAYLTMHLRDLPPKFTKLVNTKFFGANWNQKCTQLVKYSALSVNTTTFSWLLTKHFFSSFLIRSVHCRCSCKELHKMALFTWQSHITASVHSYVCLSVCLCRLVRWQCFCTVGVFGWDTIGVIVSQPSLWRQVSNYMSYSGSM